MSRGQLHTVLHQLHRLADAADAEEQSDRQLLRRFADTHDEDAFAVLVRRHGPLVLGVCHRVLHNAEDAEDVFQATFLILTRKASPTRWQNSIASWLHTVATHLAARMRRQRNRRREQERQAAQMARAKIDREEAFREIGSLLDEEMQRLPRTYREPLLLCYLEGLTCDQAARQLGWSLRTLERRLSQGRERLRQRLSRRGVSLPAALLTTGLVVENGRAGLSAELLECTIRTAVAFVDGGAKTCGSVAMLAESGLRSMAAAKMKLGVFVVLAASVLAGGAGVLARQVFVGEPPQTAQRPEQPPATRADRKPKEGPQVRVDRFGDPLPPRAVARIGSVRWWCGHAHGPLVFAPDGKRLVLLDDRGVVRILDTATGAELHRIELPNDERCPSFALAPNGKTLTTADARHSVIQIWDVRTGKELRRIEGDKRGIDALAFSPDGKTFAAGMNDSSLRLWDTATWKEIRRFAGKDSDYRHGIVFLPDGKTLISGDLGSIRWWDIATGREVRRIDSKKDGKLDGFDSFAVSPDGKRVAAIHSPQTLFLWDATTGKEIQRVELGSRRVTSCLCFSPDSQTLAWGGVGRQGQQTVFFAAATGRELRRWDEGDDGIGQLALSPDGRIVAQAKSGIIRLCDAKTGKPVVPSLGLPNYVMGVRFNRDGKSLITSCFGGRTGSWDPLTGEPRTPLRDPPEGFGRHVNVLFGAALTAHGERAALVNAKGVLHVWEPATGKVCCRIDGPPVGEDQADFSADGKALVIAHKDGVVRLWDATTGKPLRDFPRTKDIDFPRPHVLSPDGRILATGSADEEAKTIHLWDTATGNEQGRIVWQDDTLYMPSCFAFSLDGKCLLAAHSTELEPDENVQRENSLCLWDLASKRMLRRLPLPIGEVRGMALSPDGKTVAAAVNDTILLFELASGKERGRFTGHREWIWSLAFSPDGRLLASGGLDYTACVWDVTGICPDGKWPPRPEKLGELERLWVDLGDKDGVRAYRALWQLVAAPSSVAFLAQRLRPVPHVAEERLARLIADLDSERFETRERASAELQRLGERAEPALRKALANKPSLEMSRRLRALLDRVERRTLTAEQLHALRAVEVLEHVGIAEARTVLRSLATGAPADRLTREAKASLEWIARPRSPWR